MMSVRYEVLIAQMYIVIMHAPYSEVVKIFQPSFSEEATSLLSKSWCHQVVKSV